MMTNCHFFTADFVNIQLVLGILAVAYNPILAVAFDPNISLNVTKNCWSFAQHEVIMM